MNPPIKRRRTTPAPEVKEDLEVRDLEWYADQAERLAKQLDAYYPCEWPQDLMDIMHPREKWERYTEALRILNMNSMHTFLKTGNRDVWGHVFSFLGTPKHAERLEHHISQFGLVCKEARRAMHQLRPVFYDRRVLRCMDFVRKVRYEVFSMNGRAIFLAEYCNVPQTLYDAPSSRLMEYLTTHPGALERVLLSRTHWNLLMDSNARPACDLRDLPRLRDHLEDHQHQRYDAIVNKWKLAYIEKRALPRFTYTKPSKEKLWRELFPEGTKRGTTLYNTESYRSELAVHKRRMDFALGIVE